MSKAVVLLAGLFYLIQCSLGSIHKIGLVQYQPSLDASLSVKERLSTNLKNYEDILEYICASPTTCLVDLVVFPEGGLTYLAKPADYRKYSTYLNYSDIPCNNKTFYPQEYIRKLSCAAIKHRTFISANVIYYNGVYDYNANVVFNRNGSIRDIYTKCASYKTGDLRIPSWACTSSGTIMLNVQTQETYRIYTGSDIMFRSTQTSASSKTSLINQIIIPTLWVGELPFLTSLQVAAMFAQRNKVTVYIAGASDVQRGIGGSGVFNFNDPITTIGRATGQIMTNDKYQVLIYNHETSSIYSDTTPGNPGTIDQLTKEADKLILKVDPSLKYFLNKPIAPTAGPHTDTLCHKNGTNIFCCDFSWDLAYRRGSAATTPYTYHMVAYAGMRPFETAQIGTSVCAVIACLSPSFASCGRRHPDASKVDWAVTFNRLSVTGTFPITWSSIQYPNSLLSTLRPIQGNETTWSDINNGKAYVSTLALKTPQNRILTFGIYGRNFTLDVLPRSKGAAQRHWLMGGPVGLAAIVILLKCN